MNGCDEAPHVVCVPEGAGCPALLVSAHAEVRPTMTSFFFSRASLFLVNPAAFVHEVARLNPATLSISTVLERETTVEVLEREWTLPAGR